MANIKISQLPDAGVADGNELFEVVQSLSNFKISLTNVKAFILAGLNIDSIEGIQPINKGGTGAATRAAALNALLPAQTNAQSKVLTTDGINATWQAVGSAGLIPENSIGTAQMSDEAVTLAKMQPIPNDTLLGRGAASNGVVELIRVGASLIINGTVLESSGIPLLLTGNSLTAANSRNATFRVGTTSAQSLPAASTFNNGDYITLIGATCGCNVQRSGSDTLYMNGASGGGVNTLSFNFGTTVTLVSNGVSAWSVFYTANPRAFDTDNFTEPSGGFRLLVGESLFTDNQFDNGTNNVTLLKTAVGNNERYEILIEGEGYNSPLLAASANYMTLLINNTTYQNQFDVTSLRTGSSAPVQTLQSGVDFGLRLEHLGAATHHLRAIINTSTNNKHAFSEYYGRSSTGFASGNVAALHLDTSTAWTSLGTLFNNNTPAGVVTVKRLK